MDGWMGINEMPCDENAHVTYHMCMESRIRT